MKNYKQKQLDNKLKKKYNIKISKHYSVVDDDLHRMLSRYEDIWLMWYD